MKPNEFEEFSSRLVGAAEYFGKSLSPAVIGIYWEGLRDLELSEFAIALTAHVQNPDNGQFMPKIADIRRMVGGTTQDSALVAWSKVDRAVRHVGTYADVVFDDPIIHRVVHDMGGWITFGSKREDDWPFVAKEFETRYRGYRMRGEIPAYEPVLIGVAGAHNRKSGFVIDAPRLIGDARQCDRVLANGTGSPLLSIAPASAHAPHIERQAIAA